MTLSVRDVERLKRQGCTITRCSYFNSGTCLQCSRGTLWRNLLVEHVQIQEGWVAYES